MTSESEKHTIQPTVTVERNTSDRMIGLRDAVLTAGGFIGMIAITPKTTNPWIDVPVAGIFAAVGCIVGLDVYLRSSFGSAARNHPQIIDAAKRNQQSGQSVSSPASP